MLAGNLREGRSSFAMTVCNNRIYVVGGYTSSNSVTDLAECFDLKTEAVSAIARCKIASFNSTLVAASPDLLIKAGGSQGFHRMVHGLEVYHVKKNKWEVVEPELDRAGPWPQLLSSMGAALLCEGQLMFFGGYNEEREN